jgi:hypothetical protein
MTQRVLVSWRKKGWLVPPGAQTLSEPGSGRSFDWQVALPQIAWLKGLYEGGKILDDEDAAMGWYVTNPIYFGFPFAYRTDRWRFVVSLGDLLNLKEPYLVAKLHG